MNSSETKVFYGTIKCQKCSRNLAYWLSQTSYLCGVCSKKDKQRVQLTKNKAEKQSFRNEELASHQKTIELAKESNKKNGKSGTLICSKMRMMKNPELYQGFINIFPNFRHGSRKDGIGLPSLSPMSIGPIKHNQPGLPECKNLENFHQFNKVFADEIDEKGNVTKLFFDRQLEAYNDPVPHRHKPNSKKKNAPVFSIWKDESGKLVRLSYIESRQLYCHYYAESVLQNSDFKNLQTMLENGYNLCIYGYDAYNIDKPLEECYLDPSRPFGHECVLYCLLKNEFPWRKYKTLKF